MYFLYFLVKCLTFLVLSEHFNQHHVYGLIPPKITTHWFYQKLDHFTFASQALFDQTYWVSTSYHRRGRPVFIHLQSGFLLDNDRASVMSYVRQVRGTYVQLETRYKGRNQPTDGMRTHALVAYLTIEQLLADIVYFIKVFQEEWNMPEDTKYILVGASFSGTLAVWARMMYPYLIFGAVASSPLLEANYNYVGYNKVVENALHHFHPDCLKNTKLANQHLEDWILDPTEGHRKIYLKFLTCGKFDDSKTYSSRFVEMLSQRIQELVERTSNAEGERDRGDISDYCGYMIGSTNETSSLSPVERYAKFHSKRTKGSNLDECLKVDYSGMISDFRSIKQERYWLFFKCTQFGLFPVSSKRTDLFGPRLSMEYYQQICVDVFGRKFNNYTTAAGISRTNDMFGGLKYNIDRTLILHGNMDPFHPAGLVKTHSDQRTTLITMNLTSHAADMYYVPETPVRDLKYARINTIGIIKSWLV